MKTGCCVFMIRCIPDDADKLEIKPLIVAYAEQARHGDSESNSALLGGAVRWKGIAEGVKDFVANCRLCVLSSSGSKVPTPLATTLHATKSNNVIHFDYLFFGKGLDDHKYASVVKDNFSSYCWISPIVSASSEHSEKTLAHWQQIFTAPVFWISD